MDHFINLIVAGILQIFSAIGLIDNFLGKIMTSAGINPADQVIILMLAAIAVIIAGLRTFGGFVCMLIIIFLLLLMLHRLLPHINVPIFNVLPGMPSY